MRAVWKGDISFGLVNVPVTLYSAEQRSDIQLHMIDSRDYTRVRYERVNAETGDEVPWDQIVKGYEYDGSYVVLNKDELKQAAPEATQTIEIDAFVDLQEIDHMYFDKPYFLEPGKKGRKGYTLLREALQETGRAGIARVVIRTRQYMAALVPRGNLLLLNLLRFSQELRSPSDLDLPGTADEEGVTSQERKMARTLVKSMEQEWQPEQYHDEYRDALMKWIEQKIESGELHQPAESEETGSTEKHAPPPINMMEALKKSVEQTGATTSKKSRKKAARKSGRKKKAG